MPTRIFACCCGVVVFAATWLLNWETQMGGFPNGRGTELERAYKTLANYLVPTAIAIGVYLVYVGLLAPKKTGRRLSVGVIAVGVLVGFVVAARLYLRSQLDDGTGG